MTAAANVSLRYVFNGSSTFEELVGILISVLQKLIGPDSSMSTPKHHLNRYQGRYLCCNIHCDNTINTQSSDELPL